MPSTTSTVPTAASGWTGAATGGGDKPHGRDNGGGGGGDFLSGIVKRIFSPKTLVFAGLGAAAAMYIPPLAFLGGPIAGAIAGALIAQII